VSEHVDKTPTGEVEAIAPDPDEVPLLGLDAGLLLSVSTDAVVAADGWNRIVYMNASAERLFGWSADELLGKALTRIIPERFQEAHLAGFSRYLATHEPVIIGKPLRLPVLRRDGSEVDIELVLSAIVTPEGEDLLVGSLRDVSDRIELERQSAVTQQLVRVLAEATTLEETMPRLVEAIGESLGCDNAQFWVLDDRGGHLRCAQSWERPDRPCPRLADVSRQFTFRRGAGLPGRVWESGAPLWIADLASDASFPRMAAAEADGVHSAVAFPIMAAGRLFGVMEAFSRQTMDDDIELMA
jgi:two-component system, cell cycle sensor histidine kinase and response regulator CckA